LQPRSYKQSTAAKAAKDKAIQETLKSTLGNVQYSVISKTCQSIGEQRNWHLTAIEFLLFCQNDLGISSMILEEAQMLCCNRPLGQGGFEDVFNARAFVSVFSDAGKNKHSVDPIVGDIKSVAVSEWEIARGPSAFYLEYSDFRERFWNPIHKTVKTAINKLAKEQKHNVSIDSSSSSSKEQNQVEDAARESSSTWLPKVGHYDNEHYQIDRMDTKAICMAHIKRARRMKRLFTTIRKGIKRRHLSCAVAFSSFQLSMDPILSLNQVKEASKISATKVLKSPSIHLKEHEFVKALSTLAGKFIACMTYDRRSRGRRILQWKAKGKSTMSGNVDLLETRAYLQWLCLNRFDSVIEDII